MQIWCFDTDDIEDLKLVNQLFCLPRTAIGWATLPQAQWLSRIRITARYTPEWRTGTIPANHTPGLSILCIGRNLNFLSIKLNLPYSAVPKHIDSEKLYIRLQNISRNKMDLNSRPYTLLPKQKTCFATIKRLPSSFLSGE